MTEAVVQEYVRCAYCKRPVIKQKFCPRCGNILIKDDESPLKVDEKMVEEKIPEKPIETVVEKPIEQLEKLSQQTQNSEEERKVAIEMEPSETPAKKDPVTNEAESAVEVVPVSDEVKHPVATSEADTIKTVPNVIKNVKDMSNLLNLLKEDEMTEDAFLGLYNGLADDAQKLVTKRGELISEIKAAVNDYRSKMISVKHDMKLLNIRVRAAALKRDINDYKHGLREGKEAAHLENLEGLKDSAELEELMVAVNNCVDALSELHMSEEIRSKIETSMQGTLSLLKETHNSQ
jgi:hypothetical protein